MEEGKANRYAALQGGEGGQNFVKFYVTVERFLHDGDRFHIETSPLMCSANQ